LKNRNGGKEVTECRRRERRSGIGVGEKELAGKNLVERKSGKEVCWKNRAGKRFAVKNERDKIS
jgi:hypothetical protein